MSFLDGQYYAPAPEHELLLIPPDGELEQASQEDEKSPDVSQR
jgi:hypothetical protein